MILQKPYFYILKTSIIQKLTSTFFPQYSIGHEFRRFMLLRISTLEFHPPGIKLPITNRVDCEIGFRFLRNWKRHSMRIFARLTRTAVKSVTLKPSFLIMSDTMTFLLPVYARMLLGIPELPEPERWFVLRSNGIEKLNRVWQPVASHLIKLSSETTLDKFALLSGDTCTLSFRNSSRFASMKIDLYLLRFKYGLQYLQVKMSCYLELGRYSWI